MAKAKSNSTKTKETFTYVAVALYKASGQWVVGYAESSPQSAEISLVDDFGAGELGDITILKFKNVPKNSVTKKISPIVEVKI